MHGRKKFENLKLLNPKNLAKEVHVYGYHFSWKMHIFTIFCSLLGMSAVGVLFRLEPLFFGIMLFTVGILLPVFILNMYQGMYEQKRFADAVTYGEQILYSFQKSRKVVTALKETRELFEEGRMHRLIGEAIDYLEAGNVNTEGDLLREALSMIEVNYSCEKLHTIHELLINSENHGGEIQNSILLLLDDIERWKRRGYLLQAEKKTSNRDNMISIVVATVLCAVALYVMNGMGSMFPGVESIDIFSIGVIQLSSFGFILFMLFVLLKSMKRLNQDWLGNGRMLEEEYSISSYEMVMHYDEKGGRKKQVLAAVLLLLLAVVFLLRERTWVSVLCIITAVFVLAWKRISYNLAKRDVTKEIYLAMPQWLLEMALLLQNNNVQISLMKSVSVAPPILKRELELLQERLLEEPNKLHSYTDFCKNFDVPEAQSCMKMLHAISESGTGDMPVQIHHLLARVQEMQQMADDVKSKNLAFQMKLLFSYPVIAATVKLMADLSIGMVFMMQMIGSIGGIG